MSEWISVKDRLPEYDEHKENYDEFNVYCCNNKYHEPIVTTLDYTEHGWSNENNDLWNDFVTHWMPLPEPPTITT